MVASVASGVKNGNIARFNSSANPLRGDKPLFYFINKDT